MDDGTQLHVLSPSLEKVSPPTATYLINVLKMVMGLSKRYVKDS
jgi:hypothetical protein